MTRLKAILSALVISTASITAQTSPDFSLPGHPASLIKHLDVGLSLGTTGIGLDASASLSRVVRLRAGFSYTPPICVPLHFGLTTYDGGAIHSGNFDKAKDLMYQLSGFEIDDVVDINGKPTMFNFKLLTDIYPLRNKHWHLTAGFFFGPKKVGSAINTMAEMPSLLAVGIYNKQYDFFVNEQYLDKPIYGDFYVDPDVGDQIRDKMMNTGRVGIHIGDFKSDGTPYIVQPDKDGMVKARALVNMFRPYIGMGYETVVKNSDNRLKFSVDCGAMMWGGAPDIIAHDGVNLTTDVTDIRGKVGDYMKVVTALKVYPVVSIRLAYAIF